MLLFRSVQFISTFILFGLFFLVFPEVQAKNWALNSDLSCEDRNLVIDRLANDTVVKINNNTVSVGDEISVSWKRGRFPEREPVFLMISFDQPVRFRGDDFYVLLPGSEAAYNVSWNSDHTRVVIPFFGRGVAKSGRFSVTPLVNGSIGVNWTITGYNGCGSYLNSPAGTNLEINVETSNQPEIVVNDPENSVTPNHLYQNKSGDRILEILDGRFRLLDAASKDEILELVGKKPQFSPSGRFLIVLEGKNAGIFDAIDGERLTAPNNGQWMNSDWSALIWSHNDSFVLQILPGANLAVAYNFLSEKSIVLTSQGCRACSANRGRFLIDLENNVFLGEVRDEFNVWRLSDGTRISSLNKRNSSIDRVLNRARIRQGVTPFKRPVSLKYSNNVSLTGNFSYFSDDVYQNQALPDQLKPYVYQQTALKRVQLSQSSTFQGDTQIWQWRSVSGGQNLDNPKGSHNTLEKRLNEFGLNFLQPLQVTNFQFSENLPKHDDNIPFDQYQKQLLSAHEKVWRNIEATTGVNKNRFALGNGCGVYDDNKILGSFTDVWHWKYLGKHYWLTNFECAEGSAAFNNPNTMLITEDFIMFANEYSSNVQLGNKGRFRKGLNLDNPNNDTGPSCEFSLDSCRIEVKVFGNKLVLYSSAALGFAIVDTNTGKLITKKFGLPRADLFNDVLLSENGQYLFSMQKDGSFTVSELSTSNTVFSGRYVDDEIIVWTQDGRFDATSEGAHFVSYRFPGHSGNYTALQFENYLKIPGLVNKVLNGTYKHTPIKIAPPPRLRVNATQNEGTATLDLQAMSSQGIAGFSVFQDGLETNTIPVTGAPKNIARTENIEILPGTKWVSILAIDVNKVASSPYSIQLSKQVKPRKVHLLSIGVNKYDLASDDAVGDLKAAVADANLFTSAISNISGDRFTVETSTKLLDQEASPDNIVAQLRSIVASSSVGDTIAFFFAGHGVQGPDGKYYLATSKTDAADIPNTALSFNRLSEVLADSKARIVMFLDTCHSGLAGQGLFATNDDMVDSALDKIPSGIVVFSASKGRELALEDQKISQGYFTQAISEVIDTNREANDLNKNGTIELSELFRGVKGLVVKRITNSQSKLPPDERLTQTPWMARNRMVGDFSLF